MAVIWNTSYKKCILWARDIKSMSFLKLLLYQLPGHPIVFEFHVSVINPYHINGLHLFWDNYKWFCLLISSDAKCFFFSSPKHCDRVLIVVIVYYFQIWNKKLSIIKHHHHHHHHVVPPARISLTLSRHFSLSFITSGRSSGLHSVSSHSCCM